MTKQIAVMTADTHLAKGAWTHRRDLEGDSYYGLDQIVEYCTAYGLPLFLAGDVFDKKTPDPTTIAAANSCLNEMEYTNLPVYFTQGQHELDRNTTWLNAISTWPQHIHKQPIIECGIKFYGLDWLSKDTVQEAFENIPKDIDVLIAHQVWQDFMGDKVGDAECSFADVPYVKIIFTGDFHRHINQKAKNKCGNTITVLSPGATAMQNIAEDPNKYFFVLNDNLSVTSVPLKTRHCYRFEINTKDELEVFLSGNLKQAITPQDGVPDNISKNLLHIRFQENIPEAYSRLTSAIRGHAHLYLVPERNKPENIAIELEKRKAIIDGGLPECLKLMVDKDTSVYKDLALLLSSAEDPILILDRMREKFIKSRQNNDRRKI